MVLEIKGLKCDNPNCNWKDDNISFDEYDAWIDKPCPLCKQPVLTKEDYQATKRLIAINNSDWFKQIEKAANLLGATETIGQIKMNGSGNIKVVESNIVPCGGDETNYYMFYSGDCYPDNNETNIALFAKIHFDNLKDVDIDKIIKEHIIWVTDSSNYAGMYNGDTYILFDDINKLPPNIKTDAYNNIDKFSCQEVEL